MRRFRHSVFAASFVAFAFAGVSKSLADDVRAVVELFTSQGCSSCPPADALLKDYVDRDDILALTMPVDYWDYLGWKDTFAKRAFSTRQRLYAKQRGDGQVYTPQVVINGLAHAIGSRRNQIDAAIKDTQAVLSKRRISASLVREGGDLVIEAKSRGAGGEEAGSCRVWLAGIQKKGVVKIKRGENGGQNLTYYNVVRQMNPVGTWNGEDMTIRLPAKKLGKRKFESYAVLFQDGLAGPIIGAAELSDR